MKICQAVLKLWSGHKNVNTQRAITPQVGKPKLRFMCSARRLMVFNVCVKFHENMSSGFKVVFNVCVKFHENMSSGFKVMEQT